MLKITDLKKSFREPDGSPLPILDIPSFHVGEGEQMVLVGRSGSGKTTLLHNIAGISTPDSGSIQIAEVDITRLPEAGRDRFRADHIGYVFQTFNLLPAFSALENVLLGMTFSRGFCDPERAKELLSRLGLGDRLQHRPAALSVVDQPLETKARALANRPKLLLADEPTANVDAAHQQQIVDQLRQSCAAENVALVMVTHTPEVAEQFDRVDELHEVNQVLQAAK